MSSGQQGNVLNSFHTVESHTDVPAPLKCVFMNGHGTCSVFHNTVQLKIKSGEITANYV